MLPLFVLAAMVAVLGSSSSPGAAAPAAGVGRVGACGGGCGCDRCGVVGASNWTEKPSTTTPGVDPMQAFASHLVTRAFRGDVAAHQLVAVLEQAAAAGNAHASELVGHMGRAFMRQQPPISTEALFATMRTLGPVGQA